MTAAAHNYSKVVATAQWKSMAAMAGHSTLNDQGAARYALLQSDKFQLFVILCMTVGD